MKRILRSFLASILAIAMSFSAVGNSFAQPGQAQADIQQLLAGANRFAILPVAANYYRGPPNLKLVVKKRLGLYVGQFELAEVYKERFDEESDRIASDLADSLLAEFDARGLEAILVQDAEISGEIVSTLHGGYWPALLHNGILTQIDTDKGTRELPYVDAGTAARNYVEARRAKGIMPFPGSDTSDSSRIAMATSVARQAEADALVIARFWGWRKGSGAIPSMFSKKSAATFWVGLIDGETGDLIAVGYEQAHSPFFASKQRDSKINKMITNALSSLEILALAAPEITEE
jgi:hypothetical protein